MARKILVTSGKGGVGKTTVVAFLSMALAHLHQKVLVVDLDVGLNNLDGALCMENDIVFDLCDVVNERCLASQAVVRDTELNGLYALLCCRVEQWNCDKYEKCIKEINTLAKNFDYVLLDCPAGIGNMFAWATKICHEAIVVVTPTFSSVRDSSKVASLLYELNIKNTQMVVNKFRKDLSAKGKMLSVEQLQEIVNLNVLGVLPDDDEILTAKLKNVFFGNAKVYKSFVGIAKQLIYTD